MFRTFLWKKLAPGSLAVAACLGGLSAGAIAAAAENEGTSPLGIVEAPVAEDSMPATAASNAAPNQVYWIGAVCMELSPERRAALAWQREEGVYVVEVASGGPAAKGGLERGDVLFSAGAAAISGPADLLHAVRDGQGKPVSFHVWRDGAEKVVVVTPALHEATPAGPPEGDIQELRQWLEEHMPGAAMRPGTMQFHVLRPGVILPPDVLVQRPLPEGMMIQITKTGAEPTRIEVRHGEKSWKLTEKELDTLPPDVRPYVDQMLGRPVMGAERAKIFNRPTPPMAAPGFPRSPFEETAPAPSNQTGSSAAVERRLDELNQRMEKLGRAIEQMSQERLRQMSRRFHDEPGDDEAAPRDANPEQMPAEGAEEAPPTEM